MDEINHVVAIPIIVVLWIGMIIFVRWMNKKEDEE